MSLYAYSLGYDKQCNTVILPCDATCIFDFVLFSTTRLDFAIPVFCNIQLPLHHVSGLNYVYCCIDCNENYMYICIKVVVTLNKMCLH